MNNPGLGFAPAVIAVAKFAPAIISVFSSSKKEEAEEQAMREQQLAYSQELLQTGQGVLPTNVLSERDKLVLAGFWPQIHVAANFSDINWKALGYPAGPPLSPAGIAAITEAWPQVHDAARFSDIRWEYHAIPVEKVAPAMPLPELGYRDYLSQNGASYQAAGLLGGSLSPVLLAGGIGVALLFILADRR